MMFCEPTLTKILEIRRKNPVWEFNFHNVEDFPNFSSPPPLPLPPPKKKNLSGDLIISAFELV